MYQPTIATTIFMILFLVAYLVFLCRNAIRNRLDIYDALILSMVAIGPGVFVFFPEMVTFLRNLIGVGFGFLVLFGFLFVMIFLNMYRMMLQIKRLEDTRVDLVQECSLLRQELKQCMAAREDRSE